MLPGFLRCPIGFAIIAILAILKRDYARSDFDSDEIAGIMGDNWHRFYDKSFEAAP